MKKILLLFFIAAFKISTAQTILLNESFGSGTLPANWVTYNTSSPSVGWEFGDSLGSSGFDIPPNGFYAACNDDKYDDSSGAANRCERSYLVSPIINCAGTDSLTLTFDYYCEPDASGDPFFELSSNGSSFNYTSYILENASWTTYRLSIPANYVSSTFRLRFGYRDQNHKATGFAIKNILLFDPPPTDLSIVRSFHSDIIPSTNALTGCRVMNSGLNMITSFNMKVYVDGILQSTDVFTGLTLDFQKTLDCKISTPINTTDGEHQIRIELTDVNALPNDDAPLNNISEFNVKAIAGLPDRHPVLIDKTGAWCTFCADAGLQLDNTSINFPQTVPVAIHSGDMMDSLSMTTGAMFAASLYSGGYPKVGCDAYKFPENPTLSSYPRYFPNIAFERSLMYEPVGVRLKDVSWNNSNQTVTATVEATIYDTLIGDVRLNLWIVADELYGTGSGWDQVNGANSTIGHPYYGLGDPILGYHHKHVLMSMRGGVWGTDGIIPDTSYPGSIYQATYSMQVPSTFWGAQNQTNVIDSSLITLIGIAQNFDLDILNRRIYNAYQSHISDLITTVTSGNEEIKLSVYPNPCSSYFNVSSDEIISQIKVSDAVGKIILDKKVSSKQFNVITENFSPGVYIVSAKTNSGKIIQQKIIVRK